MKLTPWEDAEALLYSIPKGKTIRIPFIREWSFYTRVGPQGELEIYAYAKSGAPGIMVDESVLVKIVARKFWKEMWYE